MRQKPEQKEGWLDPGASGYKGRNTKGILKDEPIDKLDCGSLGRLSGEETIAEWLSSFCACLYPIVLYILQVVIR